MPIIILAVISPYRGKIVRVWTKNPFICSSLRFGTEHTVKSFREGRVSEETEGHRNAAFPLARLLPRCILQVVPH